LVARPVFWFENSKERKFLGTAGSLSLLPKNKYDNIFITNGDVYSKVNFKNILNEHLLKNNDITICAKVHELQLPYGVLNNKIGGDFVNEKPKINYLVNAGIYIIKNKLLNNVDYDIIYYTGGYYGFYQLGVGHYIKNNFNYKNKSTLGISAGSWLAVFMKLDKINS
jgi:NDP-sugar pyrophosphorylase family protein